MTWLWKTLTLVIAFASLNSSHTASSSSSSTVSPLWRPNMTVPKKRVTIPDQFPFLAILKFKGGVTSSPMRESRWRCFGSVVSPQSVVTSCGCILRRKFRAERAVEIRAMAERSTNAQRRVSRDVILHPKCSLSNDFYFYDLAILRLPRQRAFSFDSDIMPAKLSRVDAFEMKMKQWYPRNRGRSCVVPTWTSDSIHDEEVDNSLSWNNVSVSIRRLLPNRLCETILENYYKSASLDYPNGDDNRLTRNGIICTEKEKPKKLEDAGSPLVCDGSVVGVVSARSLDIADSNGVVRHVDFYADIRQGLELIKDDRWFDSVNTYQGNSSRSRNNTEKITFGYNARKDEFPSMVLIRMFKVNEANVRTESRCGGAILSPTKIITACHCLGTVTPTDMELWMGLTDIVGDFYVRHEEDLPQQRYAASFLCHPRCSNMNGLLLYDIGVIFIHDYDPIVYGPHVNEIDLESQLHSARYDHLMTEERAHCVVPGWGLYFNGQLPDVLRVARMKLIPDSECECIFELHYPNYPPNNDDRLRVTNNGIFCSEEVYVDEHESRGDSGGPIICKMKVNADHDYTVGSITLGTHSGSIVIKWPHTREFHLGVYTKLQIIHDFLVYENTPLLSSTTPRQDLRKRAPEERSEDDRLSPAFLRLMICSSFVLFAT